MRSLEPLNHRRRSTSPAAYTNRLPQDPRRPSSYGLSITWCFPSLQNVYRRWPAADRVHSGGHRHWLPGNRDRTASAKVVQTARLGQPGQVLALAVQAAIGASRATAAAEAKTAVVFATFDRLEQTVQDGP